MSLETLAELQRRNAKIDALRRYAGSLLSALIDVSDGHSLREMEFDIDEEIRRGVELGVEVDREEEESE